MLEARPKLIRAVVDYIEKKSPPPDELDLGWQCERFQALPAAGGVLDQSYKLMTDMIVAMNVYTAWHGWTQCKPEDQEKWIEFNPHLWKICQNIMKTDTDD